MEISRIGEVIDTTKDLHIGICILAILCVLAFSYEGRVFEYYIKLEEYVNNHKGE